MYRPILNLPTEINFSFLGFSSALEQQDSCSEEESTTNPLKCSYSAAALMVFSQINFLGSSINVIPYSDEYRILKSPTVVVSVPISKIAFN